MLPQELECKFEKIDTRPFDSNFNEFNNETSRLKTLVTKTNPCNANILP